jgi:hypothetical protein
MATPLPIGTGANQSPFSAANSTPIQFGTLQDVTLDISGTMKELYGRNAFPDAAVRAQCKITGKAKAARIYAKQFNDLFFGSFGTLATGSVLPAVDEVVTITTLTGTVVNGATLQDDLGVRYTATGKSLTKVTTLSAIGQYTMSGAGVITLYTGDPAAQVTASYTYTSATIGTSSTISNFPMGQQPTLIMNLANTNTNGLSMKVKLWAVVCVKLTLNLKNEDFTIPEFDFTAFADASNRVMTIDMGE